jgi:hypothetical protein
LVERGCDPVLRVRVRATMAVAGAVQVGVDRSHLRRFDVADLDRLSERA